MTRPIDRPAPRVSPAAPATLADVRAALRDIDAACTRLGTMRAELAVAEAACARLANPRASGVDGCVTPLTSRFAQIRRDQAQMACSLDEARATLLAGLGRLDLRAATRTLP